MSLKEYKRRRKFSKTPEPPGKKAKTSLNRFVVQEHWASHHHFDFRLEMEGVLKSWAVPKGLPKKKGIKRLAVQTEDHPVGYINFEGKISEGQYGAGKVRIYDKGKYELKEKKKGEIVFNLKGKKFKGRYNLIKMKRRKNQWLIFKS